LESGALVLPSGFCAVPVVAFAGLPEAVEEAEVCTDPWLAVEAGLAELVVEVEGPVDGSFAVEVWWGAEV
jgi:hypothetical protein